MTTITQEFFEKQNVYVPSLKRDIYLTPITVQQYKQVLSTTYNLPSLNVGFNASIVDIICNNCTDNDLLTDFDKYIIAFYLRYYNISTKYKDISLNKKIDEIKRIEHPVLKNIKTNIFDITVNVPSLEIEKQYITHILTLIQQNNTNVIDVLLIAELTKYITALSIKNTPVDFNISFAEKVNVISSLPVTAITEVVKYIDDVKQKISHIYTLTEDIMLPYNTSLLIE